MSRTMRRRGVLTTIAGGICLSGCFSQESETPSDSPAITSGRSDTRTPVRRTTNGLAATFQVVDSHTPTDDTASATFDDGEVTVTGTMDPSGCNRPTLSTVNYNSADGVVHLLIGEESPYDSTETVECGNASFDYRCVLTADSGSPEAVEVVHNHEGKDNRSFNLERD